MGEMVFFFLCAKVIASDISDAMVAEAASRANALGLSDSTSFAASDLEALSGSYDTVTCIDVMIHYPTEKMAEMVSHTRKTPRYPPCYPPCYYPAYLPCY